MSLANGTPAGEGAGVMAPRPPFGGRLRAVLYYAFLIVTVIPCALAVLVCIAGTLEMRFRIGRAWARMAVWGARVICGLRWQVKGWENLPNGPAIILPKHQSAWETFWLQAYLPRQLVFVYKRELNWVPFFGWAISSMSMINIDRSRGQDAFEQLVAKGTARLERGAWIVIFPEGTRTPPGPSRRYKTGGARLVARTGAMAVPIALNSGELWPRKAFAKIPGLITVSIGPAIDPAGLSAEEIAEKTETWIETEMRQLAPHRYAGEGEKGVIGPRRRRTANGRTRAPGK